MGGKGIRRREKNYRAAHGGSSRLPPPPVPSSLDALPSKLRKIMSLTGAGKQSLDGVRSERGNGGGGGDKKHRPVDGGDSKTIGVKRERNDQDLIEQEHGDSVLQSSIHEKKKKRRKSKKANDLRFETEEQMEVAGSKRKERKKQRLEARKKKNKKAKEENVDFQGHEKIKFGDIVEAPPKLVAFPKVSSSSFVL
ncbi:Hypothetical predicted protein [Olea europaea subsp. europaea]|uniref:Uncharacterized protein n=1 Tax=Olea europaea subsp. europaea TaxID=158383 RepID=A0A8S0SIK0_OLEEU|nr:Hypothetical predicted protein [Olea europaea subsp. europaea]